jgi:hypothetical protein
VIDVALHTNDFRDVRGRAVALAIMDECAFWRDDRSATSDVETYTAIRPGMMTLPGSMLVGISSPHKKIRAEWLAEWRDDISTFIDRALIEAAVDNGALVRD